MIDVFVGEHRFLSNFWYSAVKFDGIMYPTVEHAYQAAKTLDRVSRETIAEASTPMLAKSLGNRIELRPDWEDMKVSVMRSLLTQKFYSSLKTKLIATGNHELIEGNYWHDNFWGICTCSVCRMGIYRSDRHNVLGKLLMDIRAGINYGINY